MGYAVSISAVTIPVSVAKPALPLARALVARVPFPSYRMTYSKLTAPAFRVGLPLSLALLGLTLASGRAQTAATPSPTAAELARYDKNHDGQLDATELAALRADQARSATAPKTATSDASAEEPVQLSPFEVNAGNDKGYYSSNAMSGTRLNSKIEDLAGSVSVVTKQQLLDTAALDINDIFAYEIGTEGTRQFTDLTNDGRGDYDNVAGNPTGANRIRGLAQATIAVGGFQASSTIPIDVYNIDAVEITRGPNSTIAGLGDAGGTVNLRTARANLNRSTTNVQVRADDWGGYRASLDLNRPIVRNLLSARFSSVYENRTWVRKPSIDRTNRQQLAISFRPYDKTSINASYERYHEWAQRANSIMPRESLTFWRSQGSPTYDPVPQTFTVNGVRQAPLTTLSTVPAGIAKFGSSNVRNFEFIDDGQVQYLAKAGNPSNNSNTPQQLLQSALPAESRPLWKIPGTTNSDVYDWRRINLAAPNYEINRADIFNVQLQQTAFRTQRQQLNFEAAWRREDQLNYRRMFIAQQDGVGNTIVADVNERLLDGRANPFFGRPFIGGVNPQVYRKPVFNDNYRGQLAYEIDLRREKNALKWLGLHRVNGYAEYRLSIASPNSLRYHDSIVDNPLFTGAITPTSNLTNSAGLLMYPLFYVGKTKGGNVEYANTGATNWTGPHPASIFTSGAWSTNQQVTVNEIYFSQGFQKKKIRTVGGSVQSFLADDRIVTTFGQRKDRVYTEDSLALPLSNGFLDLQNLYNFGANKKWRKGDTTTQGVVLKPFRGWSWFERTANNGTGLSQLIAQTLRGLNFHYNRSDSFQPADTAYNVFLQELPNPTGKSEEYGVSLGMFDDKLNLRLTHQKTLQFHTRSGIGTVATRAMSIDFDVPGQTRPFDLYSTAILWQQQLHPEYTVVQAQDAAAKQIGYTVDFINSTSGKIISDVNDAESHGWELELQLNPNKYWTLRATANQQVAIDSNVSLFIQEYLNQRLPLWQTIRAPDGTLWWTTFVGSGSTDSPQTYYTANVEQPLNLAITTQGKRKPQTREYRTAIITKYQLAGLGFKNSILKNMAIGGTMRWASKGAIGYLAAPPDPDGVIRRLDRNRPFFDKAEANFDALVQYSTKLYHNKVRAMFQLNVLNLTEGGRLKGVAVNPDGQYWQYRIVEPRQFVLTASFDL